MPDGPLAVVSVTNMPRRDTLPDGNLDGDAGAGPGRSGPARALEDGWTHDVDLCSSRSPCGHDAVGWLLVAVRSALALGAERTYRVAPPAEGSKAEAVVVYSLGTHTQTAQDIRGEVTLDPATLASARGSVVVPIAGIRGDGGTRDCHMREALGLDYAAGGRFPKEHVCDGQDRLPASGPEAVAFPDIRLEVLGVRPLDDLALLEAGKPVRVELEVRWTLARRDPDRPRS